jgi:hypothetical protein
MPDKYVQGHFREALVLAGGEVVAADVSDGDAWQRAHELYDLVSGWRGGPCCQQRVVNSVECRITMQGGPVRTAPQHVRSELPVVGVGVGTVEAVLESRDEPFNRGGCLCPR